MTAASGVPAEERHIITDEIDIPPFVSNSKRGRTLSNQFGNRLPVAEDGDGATGVVDERVTDVDAEVAINRGEQVLRGVGPFGGKLGFRVCGTDDLPHP